MYHLSLFVGFWLNIVSLHPLSQVEKHDFHVSLCEMNYEEDRNALEISLHLFADDIERALMQGGRRTLHLATEMEVDSANIYLERYLFEKFQVRANDQQLQWNFLGKEKTDDFMGMWCYFEISNLPTTDEIEIVNEILFELFSDQKNILHYSHSGEMKESFYYHPEARVKRIALR